MNLHEVNITLADIENRLLRFLSNEGGDFSYEASDDSWSDEHDFSKNEDELHARRLQREFLNGLAEHLAEGVHGHYGAVSFYKGVAQHTGNDTKDGTELSIQIDYTEGGDSRLLILDFELDNKNDLYVWAENPDKKGSFDKVYPMKVGDRPSELAKAIIRDAIASKIL